MNNVRYALNNITTQELDEWFYWTFEECKKELNKKLKDGQYGEIIKFHYVDDDSDERVTDAVTFFKKSRDKLIIVSSAEAENGGVSTKKRKHVIYLSDKEINHLLYLEKRLKENYNDGVDFNQDEEDRLVIGDILDKVGV